MRALRLPAIVALLAFASLPAASAGPSAATETIFLPPGVTEAQIVQAPYPLDVPVKVTISGLLTAIPKVGPDKGKKACYDVFYYTNDCRDWKGPGKSYFIGAGKPGCQAAKCMTSRLSGLGVFPKFSANHTYKLEFDGKGEGWLWAYPFGQALPWKWGGGFTVEFESGCPPCSELPVRSDVTIFLRGKSFVPGIAHLRDGGNLTLCNRSGTVWSPLSVSKYNRFDFNANRIGRGECRTLTLHNPTRQPFLVKIHDGVKSYARLLVLVEPR